MRAAFIVLALLALGGPAAGQQNPFARTRPPAAWTLDGVWNGVNLERRSGCANAQNDGSRGTYAQFEVGTTAAGEIFITQSGVTGLNCTYRGRYAAQGETLALQGTYDCTDGKAGTFRSSAFDASPTLLHIRLDAQLTGSESCAIAGILSMARQPP
jgi:hypothetical protein